MAWKLFYDGGCNLCHTSKLRAEKWAERAGVDLQVDVLQGPEAQQKGYELTTMVLEAEQVYYGADAWLRILSIAPWYLRWLSALRLTRPTRWLAALAYGVVARLRYRLFGTRACPLPGAKPQVGQR